MSVETHERPVALFFPGQGSQHKGMGADYYDLSRAAKVVFNKADALALKFKLGFSITELCFEDPKQELKGKNADTAKIQPALLTVDIAIFEHLKSMGLKPPKYIAGHSAGKLIAPVAVGVMDFETGFEMMVHRGQEMKNSRGNREGVVGIIDTTGKVIPGIDPELGLLGLVQEVFAELGPLASSFRTSVENSFTQVMVSGLKTQADLVFEKLEKIPHRLLDIYEGAPVSHNPLLADAQQGLNDFIEGLRGRISGFTLPLIDDRNGLVITSPGEYIDSLRDHIIAPISWRKVIKTAVEGGAEVGFEVGPGKVLRGFSTRGTGLEMYTTGTIEEAARAKHLYPLAFAA